MIVGQEISVSIFWSAQHFPEESRFGLKDIKELSTERLEQFYNGIKFFAFQDSKAFFAKPMTLQTIFL